MKMESIKSAFVTWSIAAVIGFVVFWLVRFAGWADSLMSVKTHFYWTVNHAAAWVLAIIAAIGAAIVSRD